MSKQSVSEIIDSWETHGLQNLHEISFDRIYAFPLTRNDIDIRESSTQWHLDHYGICRQRLVETKDEQVKDLMVDIDLQVREVSERAWQYILETVIYQCDPDESETISSEFDREVDSHCYLMKKKFEKISELLTNNSCKLEV
ncbi:hypothetical protein OAL97_03785 [Paracoccaceae bacterium]|nr:hypothetical protein [Paracoccaceae bacterium]